MIHATKKVDKGICVEEAFRSILAEYGYTAENLPVGAVVAIANLTECWRSLGKGYLSGVPILQNGIKGQTKQISPQKDSFGWFESGRDAWEMAAVNQIDPVPVKRTARTLELGRGTGCLQDVRLNSEASGGNGEWLLEAS